MARFLYVAAALLIVLSQVTSSKAMTNPQETCPEKPGESCLQFVGIFRQSYLENEDVEEASEGETVVGSVANYFSIATEDESTGIGNVKMRVWSRNESVAARYSVPSETPAFAVADRVTFKVASVSGQSGNDPFTVLGVSPGQKDVDSDTGILVAVLYDIFGYFGVPTNVISVIANNISVGKITIRSGQSEGEVTIEAPFSPNPLSGLGINLDPQTSYIQADIDNQGINSGIQANFDYAVIGANLDQDFLITPEATIRYQVTVGEDEAIATFFIDSRPLTATFAVQQRPKVYLPILLR